MKRNVAVIGLGYVGFPVAISFSKLSKTIGFDIDEDRVAELKNGYDRTNEGSFTEIPKENLWFTSDPDVLKNADFFIVAVPTPIDNARKPNLAALLDVSSMLGGILKKGERSETREK